MLSKIMRNKQAFRMLTLNKRNFAALNANSINIQSMNPADIHDSDARTVGAVMRQLAINKDEQRAEVCNEVEEYFRRRFRQITFDEARDILMNIGVPDDQSV